MKDRIKILYVFHVSEIGGGSYCLLNILKHLDTKTFCPIVLLKNDGPLATELIKLGVSVYFEKSINTVLYNKSIFKINSISQICKLIFSMSKIKEWLINIKPNIVHLNTMMLYPYLVQASVLGIKSVLHVRENWPVNEHQLQLKFARWIIKKHANKIVAINKSSADILKLYDKTTIIHDYISFEGRDGHCDFEKLFSEDFRSLKVFSFLGGANWQKGALQVVETFTDHIKNNNVRLLIVGVNSKEVIFNGIRGKIKKLLSKIGYYRYNDKVKLIAQKDERIVFIPATYHVKSILEQSSCYISFFSIPHANLSMAEASCLGVPSIAANTPEAKEYSNNGESALLFKMNNKSDFKQKILDFLNNESEINIKARNGVENMKKLFSPEKNSLLLNDSYNELIS